MNQNTSRKRQAFTKWLFVSSTADEAVRRSGQAEAAFMKEFVGFLHNEGQRRLEKASAEEKVVTTYRSSHGMDLKVLIEPEIEATAVMLPDEPLPSRTELQNMVTIKEKEEAIQF